MKKKKQPIKASLLALVAGLVVLVSCETATEPEKDVDLRNPNLPLSNSLIEVEQIYDGTQLIWDLIDGPAGFYYEGYQEDGCVVGSTDFLGYEQWRQTLPFNVREILKLPQSVGAASEGVLVVSCFDSDGDDWSNYGYLTVLSKDGSILDQKAYGSVDEALVLTAVTHTAEPWTFIAVGGTRINGVRCPMIVLFTVSPDGEITKLETKVFEEVLHVLFGDVIRRYTDFGQEPPRVSSQWISRYFISGYRYSPDPGNITAHRLDLTAAPDSFALNLSWSADVVAFKGMKTTPCSGQTITTNQNVVYVVGSTDIDKGEGNPTGGVYWDAGLVASFTEDGHQNWIKVVELTGYSDRYYGCYITSSGLYAVGVSSAFWYSESRRVFGYGLVSRLEAGTGNELAHMTFGDPNYASGFGTFLQTPSGNYCGGWTKEAVSGGNQNGWLIGFDIDFSGSEPDWSRLPATVSTDARPLQGSSLQRLPFGPH